jgi:hypothetical protein
MRVPAEALISRLVLDGEAVPILKDGKGAIQVSLPTGKSALEADWELSGRARMMLVPPVPAFSEAVGTLWHRVYAANGDTVLEAGGLAGSPRVALWPSLGACLALALVLWLVTRWGRAPLSSPMLMVVSMLGFAILDPLASVPLALVLGFGRFLARASRERHRLRIILELLVWGALIVTAVVVVFVTLHQALFSGDPLEVSSFVSGGDVPAAETWGYASLVWGTFLAGDPAASGSLPSPWVFTAPVVLIRLVWAVWAVTMAIFLAREGKLALQHLAAYWQAVQWTKPKVVTARV